MDNRKFTFQEAIDYIFACWQSSIPNRFEFYSETDEELKIIVSNDKFSFRRGLKFSGEDLTPSELNHVNDFVILVTNEE